MSPPPDEYHSGGGEVSPAVCGCHDTVDNGCTGNLSDAAGSDKPCGRQLCWRGDDHVRYRRSCGRRADA